MISYLRDQQEYNIRSLSISGVGSGIQEYQMSGIGIIIM